MSDNPPALPSLYGVNNMKQGVIQLYQTGASCSLGQVNETLCEKCIQEVEIQRESADLNLYGDIRTQYNRYDLMLEMKGIPLKLMQQILRIWDKHQLSIYNPNAIIVEFGCLVSKPGANGQIIHTDTDDDIQYKDAASFGIPLQDISSTMGPLIIKPNAKTWYKVTAKTGQVYAWSQRVEHAGGANSSNHTRYVLYFSIIYPPIKQVDVGGSTLRPEYGMGVSVHSVMGI